MKVLCILQARTSSTRFPGKVLKLILDKPMLALQLERIARARRVDAVVVATSVESSDDEIEALCRRLGVDCHRGSLNDVLDRFYHAAQRYAPEHVLRLTGDCPLTDSVLVDELIDLHLRNSNDFTSNSHERTYPDGLDAEIFTYAFLRQAWSQARSLREREHVTLYMYRTGAVFKLGALKDLVNRSKMRWTVDYPEDFAFVTRVFEALYPTNPAFGAQDVYRLLAEHPEICRLNAQRVV